MSGQVDIVSVQINEDTGAFEINLKAYRGKKPKRYWMEMTRRTGVPGEF